MTSWGPGVTCCERLRLLELRPMCVIALRGQEQSGVEGPKRIQKRKKGKMVLTYYYFSKPNY